MVFNTLRFYIFGRKHFTRNGWLHVSSTSEHYKNDPLQDPSITLQGKTYVVTGASSGLGEEFTFLLASKLAKTYMVVRTKSKGEEVRKSIIERIVSKSTKDFNPENIIVLTGDMSLESDVRRVAAELKEREAYLDGVVCNAGSLLDKKTMTKEGKEVTFATQVLYGVYLLGNLCLPLLEQSPNTPRLLFVTSGGGLPSPLESWEIMSGEKGSYNGFAAYSFCKRAQMVIAEEMAKKGYKTQIITAHPGWSESPGVAASFGSGQFFLQPLRSLYEGCEGMAWALAFASKDQIESGGLYLDRHIQDKHFTSSTKYTKEEAEKFMLRLNKEVPL